MARVLVMDVYSNELRFAECNDLEDFYRELGEGVRVFDIVRRKVYGRWYDIYVDDEGLLKDNPVVSAVDDDFNPALVGNLIFTHTDSTGETVDVADEDSWAIQEALMTAFTPEKPDGYSVVKVSF